MPVRNALPYLKEAVDSLLAQTFAEIEILALDDESTDGSGEFLESVKDPRMRVFRCKRQGVAPLRNQGLNLARGQYYAVMDADDISLPSRIERQVAFLDQNPEIVACGSQAITIDAAGDELWPSDFPRSHAAIFANLAACSNPMLHPATIIRVQSLSAVGGYACNRSTVEDFDLWWRLCTRGRLANHPDVLVKYRWHGANVSIVGRDLQLRLSRELTIDHLLANGIASCADEGDAYFSFCTSGTRNPDSISRREITALSAISKRLPRFAAGSPCFSDEDAGEMRRYLRWILIARGLRCSRLSLNRYRLLLLSSRLFPEEGGFRRVLSRQLRKLYAGRRPSDGTDG
jgi:glycosyltransferase involved in cell wall biosynthesis